MVTGQRKVKVQCVVENYPESCFFLACPECCGIVKLIGKFFNFGALAFISTNSGADKI